MISRLIKEETGDGIVCAVDKGRVFVAPVDVGGRTARVKSVSPVTGCGRGGCGGGNCGGCFSPDAVGNGYVGRFYISVDSGANFKPGDFIRFSRFIPEPNLASILVFGTPIAFVAITMLVWFVKAPQSVESPGALISIIGAFFGGFVVVGMIDRLFKAKYPAAVIGTSNNGVSVKITEPPASASKEHQ